MLIALLAFAAAPKTSRAQAPGKPARIGTIWAGTAAGSQHLMRGFVRGLEDAGLVEGKNIVLETIYADGRPERLGPFAAQLAHVKVEVIFAAGNAAVDAVRQKAPSTPTVFALTADPVKLGFVKSLSRPGGNLTGTTIMGAELSGKRLELLHELLPRATKLGVLYHPAEPSAPIYLQYLEEAAKRIRFELLKVPASKASELEGVFSRLATAGVDAVVVVDNPTFHGFREAIAGAAVKHRLPSVHGNPEYSELGGLLYYGTDLAESCRQAARLVASILRGTKPADLPVEQPTRFQLFVNLKTARALGIAVPRTVLLRADRVIE